MEVFDLAVIGSGPGGYVAAIRAAQGGLKVALIESAELGGVCLNWGCIPTKTLLHSAQLLHSIQHSHDFGIQSSVPEFQLSAMVKRSRDVADTNSQGIAFLIKKNRITHLQGHAQFLPREANEPFSLQLQGAESTTIQCHKVLLATGAEPRKHPLFPIDGQRIWNHRHAMSSIELPKHLVIIGAGAIGLEFAWFYRTLGCDVTLVEAQEHILPLEDADMARALTTSFSKQGIRILPSHTVQSVQEVTQGLQLNLQSAQNTEFLLEASHVLVAIGMIPRTSALGLENIGLEVTEKNAIPIDSKYRTPVNGIWAIGDCTGQLLLAHKASADAIAAVHDILGLDHPAVDFNQVPTAIYTEPAFASLGLKEYQLKQQGISYSIGRFSFAASGKARAVGKTEGSIKLLFSKDSGCLLGAQILGGEAPEMISQLLGYPHWESIAHRIFGHPTWSESLAEAALASQRMAIHC